MSLSRCLTEYKTGFGPLHVGLVIPHWQLQTVVGRYFEQVWDGLDQGPEPAWVGHSGPLGHGKRYKRSSGGAWAPNCCSLYIHPPPLTAGSPVLEAGVVTELGQLFQMLGALQGKAGALQGHRALNMPATPQPLPRPCILLICFGSASPSVLTAFWPCCVE